MPRESWTLEGLSEGEWIALQRLLRLAIDAGADNKMQGRQITPLLSLYEKAKSAVRISASGKPVVPRGTGVRKNTA